MSLNYRQAFLRAAEAQILRVWQVVRANGPLAEDERRLAAILLAHPEWQRCWDGAARAASAAVADPDRNPFLHVHLHFLLEQQAAERKPAEIAEILAAAGDRRAERIHRLIPLLWSSLHDALRAGRPFDPQAYAERLRKLVPVRVS